MLKIYILKSHFCEALKFIYKTLLSLKYINNNDLFKTFCKLLKLFSFNKKDFNKRDFNEFI